MLLEKEDQAFDPIDPPEQARSLGFSLCMQMFSDQGFHWRWVTLVVPYEPRMLNKVGSETVTITCHSTQ